MWLQRLEALRLPTPVSPALAQQFLHELQGHVACDLTLARPATSWWWVLFFVVLLALVGVLARLLLRP